MNNAANTSDLDALTREGTAFQTFAELLSHELPTFDVRNRKHVALAEELAARGKRVFWVG